MTRGAVGGAEPCTTIYGWGYEHFFHDWKDKTCTTFGTGAVVVWIWALSAPETWLAFLYIVNKDRLLGRV